MATTLGFARLQFRPDSTPFYVQPGTGTRIEMQLDRYITTTERRLPDGERNKPADTQVYQIRKRRVLQLSIDFDSSVTNKPQLNDFMKKAGIGTIQFYSAGSYGRFGPETTDYQWLLDNAEMVEDRTGIAKLSIQVSKYTQWQNEQTALSLEDLGD